MNALAQWNQLNEVADLQQSLGSLFSRPCVHWPEQHPRAPQRIPLVAVRENARGYVLKAELPQVKQEDAKITIEDDTLTITGDRTFDLNRKKDHPAEHAYGRFAHSFEVTADARSAKVNAVFKNGVLTVLLAKSSCALFASRPDVSPFPTLRLNRRDQFNEPEHEAKA
jgi:HSP20 family protein